MVEQENLNSILNFEIAIATSVFLALAVIVFTIFYQRRLLDKKIQVEQLRNEHQVRLMESMAEAQELERRRIAVDLHDDVGATLSAVKLYISQKDLRAAFPGITSKALELLEHTTASVREISRDLLPANLEEYGLTSAVTSLCQKIRDAGTHAVEFKSSGFTRQPEMIELHLYRIIQELLNNTMKHAKATQIDIKLHQGQDGITLQYLDNGIGMSLPDTVNVKSKGLGMKTIASRAEILKGKLDFREGAEGGLSFSLFIENSIAS